MSDLEIYLRWISRMTFLGWTGVLASVATFVLIFTNIIPSGGWAITAGIASGIVLVLSIALLFNMSNRTDEIEGQLRGSGL